MENYSEIEEKLKREAWNAFMETFLKEEIAGIYRQLQVEFSREWDKRHE